MIGLTVTHLEQSPTDSSADRILLQISAWYSRGDELRSQAEEEKENNWSVLRCISVLQFVLPIKPGALLTIYLLNQYMCPAAHHEC